MTTSVVKRATTGQQLTDGFGQWENVANLGVDGSATYWGNSTSFATGSGVVAKGFGFAIPAGATIDGIRMWIRRDTTAGDTIRDRYVSLWDGTARVGTNQSTYPTNWSTSYEIVAYGGATDDWGGVATPEMLNDTDFGIYVSTQHYEDYAISYIDYIELQIDYTLPSFPTTMGIIG